MSGLFNSLVKSLYGFGAVPEHMNLDPDQARQQIAGQDNLQVVDVRTESEYRRGYIKGAVLIPVGELEQRLKEIDPGRPCLLYCAGGGRSAQAIRIMMEKGYDKLSHIAEGFSGWERAGFPAER